MTQTSRTDETLAPEEEMCSEAAHYEFSLTRRAFVQVLGAGLLVTAHAGSAFAQRRSASASRTIAARIHIGEDGLVRVLTGKVELGQGARTQLTQAVAEELFLPIERIHLIMADTDLVPNDGGTYGSLTTPRTVPVVRKTAAAAREILIDAACAHWDASRDTVELRDGEAIHKPSQKRLSYAELAKEDGAAAAFEAKASQDVEVTPVDAWRVLGTPVARTNARDLVTGKHRFPSDIVRPGMLYGKVLRAPSYGAVLEAIDLGPAEKMKDVVAVHDGQFVGVAAPTTHQARKALEAVAATARWKTDAHPSSKDLFTLLKQGAESGESAPGGRRRRGGRTQGSVEDGLAKAKQVVRATYEVPYIQHAPMEPRAAVAEWQDGNLTAWTGTQRPFGVRGELARAFGIPSRQVRAIIPDTGGAFGGKHTADAAIEAARLAQAAKRPVSLRWTREEEFTWAYFRPAGVIEIAAGLDGDGHLIAWEYTNINSGGSGLESPYAIANMKTQLIPCDAPLRQGSYRALASTANNFAREAFMDELAIKAGTDPLAFRLAHLENERLRDVLVAAAEAFDFAQRRENAGPDVGIGLACGTEKASFVAACVEVDLGRGVGRLKVRRICQAFECGAIQNPQNLRSQVEGCLMMGMGGALTEAIHFENGVITNATFKNYEVPRFEDLPELDIHLLDRRDLPSVGAGETPIMALAPAIANAVLHATGRHLRSLPLRSADNEEA